jgi:creatinine amidohydrolase
MTLLEWGSASRDVVTAELARGTPVVLPVGALEQHGDHLSTDTDAYIATAVVREGATRARSTVVALPCLPFGVSPYHARFGGTVWLSGPTFVAVFTDICNAVREAGARVLLAVNGHGGNIGSLDTVGLTASDASFSVIPISYWDLAPEEAVKVFAADKGAIGHAGQAETSLALAIRGSSVREFCDGAHESIDVELARDRAAVDGLGNSGVVGDPSSASAEAGKEFFDAVCTELAAIFDAVTEHYVI